MIIKTDESTVETVGDVKEYKTSIDPKNLEFITTLLSSNLYSAPERSFIREIVSNAWDAHVEAGTTDTPVILKVTDDSILIRDYGTGLSPERFNNVFCNIGSSTKRDSNKYLGAFGIGRFASLSCSNIVNYTSYYNGVETGYIMVKDGNSITINEIYKKNTEEKNGLQVEITNIHNIQTYINALKFIIFFPNIFVDYKCPKYLSTFNFNNINNIKIKHFTNFAVANILVSNKILLGNVLYPCNINMLKDECREFIDDTIKYTGIAIKFDIGTLKVTPNREELIYDSDTIKIIEEKILKAKKEVADLIFSKINHNCTDIIEYYNYIHNLINFDCFKEEITDNSRDSFIISVLARSLGLDNKITFNNKILTEDEFNFISRVVNLNIPNYRGVLIDGRFSKIKNSSWKIREYNKIGTSNYPVIINVKRFTSIMKCYMEEKYTDTIICDQFSIEDLKKYINKEGYYNNHSALDTELIKYNYLVEHIYNHIINKWYLETFSSQNFLDFKKDYTEEHKQDSSIKNVILYCYNIDGYSMYYSIRKFYSSIEEAIKFIKSIKQGVVISNINRELENLYKEICKNKGYGYITANAAVIKRLREECFTNTVSLDWVLNEDSYIKKVSSILSNLDSCDDTTLDSQVIRTLPDCLKNEIKKEINPITNKDNFYLIRYLRNNPCEKDSYIDYLCKEYIKYRNKYKEIIEKSSLFDYRDSSLKDLIINTLLLKNKVYRINKDTYNSIRHNSLINLLYAREKDNN